jgi:hypothetical protein
MTKADKLERDKAITQLREWIKPGDTVYTILDSVSRSGMSRQIRVVVPYTREDGTIDHLHPNYSVAKAIGQRQAKKGNGIIMGGCGMDMGFALVYELSQVLYGGRGCSCERWFKDGVKYSGEEYRARVGGGRVSDGWQFLPDPACTDCGGSGYLKTSGYQCLGKGKCPSNYHSNHHDTIHCPGTRVYNPDGPDTGQVCYKPSAFYRYPIPENWPTIDLPIGEGETITVLAACITDDNDENPQICPTCSGVGSLPNPEGPERFDLVHTDGYALRHRWL